MTACQVAGSRWVVRLLAVPDIFCWGEGRKLGSACWSCRCCVTVAVVVVEQDGADDGGGGEG